MPIAAALLSAPKIIYNDTWGGTGQRTIILPRPKPMGFEATPAEDRILNTTDTGLTQGLFRFEREELLYSADFVPDAIAAEIRRLFRSTRAYESFVFTRHKDLATAFPSAGAPIHDNIFSVQWAPDYNRLEYKSSGAYGIWGLTLRMIQFLT